MFTVAELQEMEKAGTLKGMFTQEQIPERDIPCSGKPRHKPQRSKSDCGISGKV